MTRRRRILISAGIVATCIVATIGVLAMLPARPGVTKANFDRIEKGMTLAEVEAILGETEFSIGHTVNSRSNVNMWMCVDGACASVDFEDNAVWSSQWTESTETIPDKFRRWLHLPK